MSYLEEIVPPVLACFSDQDARVRYYACESMYNIAKVVKGEILVYFNEVFDGLTKVKEPPRPSEKLAQVQMGCGLIKICACSWQRMLNCLSRTVPSCSTV